MIDYDVIIIGAGQAGIPLARRLSKSGRRVAIVERAHLGGSCVNFGCTPTKAVLASARVAHLARRAPEFGVHVAQIQVDFPKVIARARAIVEASRRGLAKGLAECGADVLHGNGRFTGRDAEGFKIAVDDRSYRAKQVIINTGARTRMPAIRGLESVPWIDAGNWLNLTTLPHHIVFAGAGYIGLELAQFYRRMGARVTVIGPDAQVLAREDADVADEIQRQLEAEGIEFRLNARVVVAAPTPAGVRLTIESTGHAATSTSPSAPGQRPTDASSNASGSAENGDDVLEASHLFIATGRQPNTDHLGLESIGLTAEANGALAVDDRLATRVPGVWVAGDARGEPMFTHSSWDDHRILESQLLGDGSRTTAHRIVPYAVFTDPELGRVGLTEKQARQKFGDAVRVATFPMKQNGKANQQGATAGFIKLIAEPDAGTLLGAAVLAEEGAELVGNYITLLNTRATLQAICQGIYIHPTLTEAVQSATAALDLGFSGSVIKP